MKFVQYLKLKQTFVSLFLICIPAIMNSQISRNWRFGNKAGIVFGNTFPYTPISIPNSTSPLYTSEGCASISDNAGNLLFYTDGVSVYNNDNTLLLSGSSPYFLEGDPSSTQSAIILPKPGTYNTGLERFNNYYIITIGERGGKINAYEILTSGPATSLTISATASLPLWQTNNVNSVCEKVTAVCKGNNSGEYWVITHGFGSANDSFFVFNVNNSGISLASTPIGRQAVGSVAPLGPGQNGSVGYLKASAQNDRLVLACYGSSNSPDSSTWNDGYFELYGFNNSTGQITLTHTFPINSGGLPANGRPYGVEFSSDGNSFFGSLQTLGVYKLSCNPPYSVSQICSQSTPAYRFGALQIGIDDKIYIARTNALFLSSISNTNNATSSDYANIGISLNNQSMNGLPNFIQCLATPTPCPTTDTVNYVKCTSYTWPVNGQTYTSSGTYTGTSINNCGFVLTSVLNLTIAPAPEVTIQVDNTTVPCCPTATVTGGTAPYSYLWSDFSIAPQLACPPQLPNGTYTLIVTDDNGCMDTATVLIDCPPCTQTNLPPIVNLNVGTCDSCPGVKATIKGGLVIDQSGENIGSIANTLKLGSCNSGEAIGSKRNTGSNQNGLDFYTNFTNRMVVLNNGNVGINTLAPHEKFEVRNGSIAITGGNQGQGGPMLLFGENGAAQTGNNYGNWGIEYETTESGGGLNFWKPGGSAGGFENWLLFLKNNGNVGIGTKTHGNRFEISSYPNSPSKSGLRFTHLTSDSVALPSNGKQLTVNSNGDVILTQCCSGPSPSPWGAISSGTFVPNTNSTVYSIDTTASVAIGTNNSYSSSLGLNPRLMIKGGDMVIQENPANNPGAPDPGADLYLLDSNGKGAILTGQGGQAYITSWGNNASINFNYSNGLSATTGMIFHGDSLNKGKLQIGNVSTPGNYLLYVEKGIMTEKLRVAIKSNLNWSDHVFSKSYSLPTIESMDQFIQKHKHLPGIPSADELVNSGLDVGEMQAKQMAKIEELSLYVIQLQKQINELKSNRQSSNKKTK